MATGKNCGIATRPAYIYVAVQHGREERCKIGVSYHPESRLQSTRTWEIENPWRIAAKFPVPDGEHCETDIHRKLLPVNIKDPSTGRPTEHFSISPQEAIDFISQVATSYQPMMEQLVQKQKNALGTKSEADAIEWLLNRRFGSDTIRWAIDYAMGEGSRAEQKRIQLQKRGLTVIPEKKLVLISKHHGHQLFERGPFAFTWQQVLGDVVGFNTYEKAVFEYQFAGQPIANMGYHLPSVRYPVNF